MEPMFWSPQYTDMDTIFKESPHRRYNILTGEWVLVSPHRAKRPWQGKVEQTPLDTKPTYDEKCYLCPGNTRANGEKNPDYKKPFSFVNDFSALKDDTESSNFSEGLLRAKTERGICKVVCFSPDHSLTLPLMTVEAIADVISLWQEEYRSLGSKEHINHVQIFENKGAMMGCSNPHPHGQIWAQESIPVEALKKNTKALEYWDQNKQGLLEDYLEQELILDQRIIYANEHFVVLVPYWAVWPYESMILPRKKISRITELDEEQKIAFADTIKVNTIKYDNLFQTSFPYSAGIHQAPTDGKDHPEWHFHMSFYPPLLRSATVKKFMVGYEMFADSQRDISAEQAAQTLKQLSNIHYRG